MAQWISALDVQFKGCGFESHPGGGGRVSLDFRQKIRNLEFTFSKLFKNVHSVVLKISLLEHGEFFKRRRREHIARLPSGVQSLVFRKKFSKLEITFSKLFKNVYSVFLIKFTFRTWSIDLSGNYVTTAWK